MTSGDQPPLGPIATAALRSLQDAFAERNHNPGTAHMAALSAIMGTLEAMADGRTAPKVYLSALDPGTGKTQSVVHFARTLAASPAHRDTGMLILVGRIKEAEDLAREMGDALRPSMAVWTAQTDLNDAWSGAQPADAQILITTQQRVERAVRGSKFAGIAALHYRGRPRAVRVWDETWLPGVAVTLRRDDVLGLLAPLRAPFPGLAAALDTFGAALGGLSHDQTVDIPDFEALTGVSMYEVMDAPGAKFTDQQHDALRDLYAAGGTTVRAWDDPMQGVSLVTYSDLWPDDFAPVLVLDASGRVRSTYSTMAEHRDNLVSLPTAVKDYGPMRVMLWSAAGGKHAFQHDTKRGHLIEGIADLIRTRPEERWLVVAHRHTRRQKSTTQLLQRHLPGVSVTDEPPLDPASSAPTVQVITWGRHMASNAFADIPNVILAGTLFMRDSQNTALTHLAQGRSVQGGFRPRDEVAAIVRGEHAHHILQALCRGRVRQLDGERCRDMNAYIIASERSGIADLIPSIFPGCQVDEWRRDNKLTGKLGEAVAWLERETRQDTRKVSYKALQDAITVSSKNFAKLVTGHDAWSEALARLGWQPDRDQRARNLIRTVRV